MKANLISKYFEVFKNWIVIDLDDIEELLDKKVIKGKINLGNKYNNKEVKIIIGK